MDIPNLYYVVPYPLCVLCGFIHVLCGSIPSLCTMWVHTCTMWVHTLSVYYVGSYMYYVGPYLLCVLCGSIPSTIHLKIILKLVSCYNIILKAYGGYVGA